MITIYTEGLYNVEDARADYEAAKRKEAERLESVATAHLHRLLATIQEEACDGFNYYDESMAKNAELYEVHRVVMNALKELGFQVWREDMTLCITWAK